MTKNMAISHAPIIHLSPAKINLFLHIIGKRTDGYHSLQTVFRLLDWGDYLYFSIADESIATIDNAADNSPIDVNKLCSQLLTLTGADTITSSIEDNLIFKAAYSLMTAAIDLNKLPKQLPQVEVTLDKRLPMGAGLGGGSSNAATTLIALNEIWQLNFNQDMLIKIGAKVGADVPIFIFGQDAIAMGIGEELTAIDLPDQQYLVLTPDAHVNTAEIFAHHKLQRDITPLSIQTIKSKYENYGQNLIAPYHNVFTPIVTSLAPAVNEALGYLQSLEKETLGSAVFLPLDSSMTDNKELLANWLTNAPCPAYIVSNLQTSM